MALTVTDLWGHLSFRDTVYGAFLTVGTRCSQVLRDARYIIEH